MLTVQAGLDHPPRCEFASRSTFNISGERAYRLEGLWQLHWYHYHAPCWIAGERYELEPGAMTLIAPGTPSRYHFPGEGQHLCVHLHLESCESPVELPIHVPPHRLSKQVLSDFEHAIASTQQRPSQAAALIWAILWRLADLTPAEHDSLVDRACRYIESQLGHELDVPTVAAACGCSVNTLIRHFQAQLGITPAAYIRQRRAERARHLLVNLRMKPADVAQELGFPDLQRFNKAIRAATGKSPRQLQSP